MTSIYRPQMGQRGPLAAPSSPLVPQGTQQPAPYKPAPVAPGINFNPPQQPAAPMMPGQQQRQQAQQTQQSPNAGYGEVRAAVMPQYGTTMPLDDMPLDYGPGMLPLQPPGIQPPTDDLAEIMGKYKAKQTPPPEIPPYNPPFEPPGMGRGYPEMPGRGGQYPGMPGMGGRGMGRQQMMMQQQQMMRQIQMLQQMMQQQMMQRQMRRGNRQQPMVGFGPDISNFQEPANGNNLYSDGPGFAAYKKGGTVKEKKMAMGGMGGMSGPGMYGVAPGMSRGLAQKVGAANQAEAMSQLKGAIGAPGGVAGGTMKNALGALRGMKKGGKVEEAGMVGKEVAFMKKKGAPKSMVKHEEAEMKGYAKGGGIESKGKTKGKIVKMASGGMVGHASSRADGCAQRGKTRCKQVKMSGGGSC